MDKLLLEVKTNRYLLNNIALSLFETNKKLDIILKDLNKNKDHESKPLKPIPKHEAVKFELFAINESKYKQLIEEYGVDVVNKACVMLDDFIRDNGYIPHRTPYQALKKVLIVEALKSKLDTLKVDTVDIKDIDVSLIDNKKDALTYILNTPAHLRNISNDVIYLKKKFEIE